MILAALVLAAAAPVVVPTSNPTVQQAFDAADGLAEKGDWAGALAAYRALDARVKSASSGATLAARKGEALLQLGREEEAETVMRGALKALPAGAATVVPRYALGLLLGKMDEENFAYEAARADYAGARDAAPDQASRTTATVGLARVEMFIDPAAAVADAEAAYRAAAVPGATPAMLAGYRTLKGRALMNAHRYDAAFAELDAATTALGGLTTRLDRNDLVARSDAAIAGLLAGKTEAARKILSYTGAGNRFAGFAASAQARPPACGLGEADEPRRDDVAVVEFDIRDDGTVARVRPIYLSRAQPQVARAFGEAVSGWSWRPEAVTPIKPFFRSGVRVELRCSTTVERPVVDDQLAQDVDAWLTARHVPLWPKGQAAAAEAVALRAELARREAADGKAAVSLLPVLAAIVDNPVTTAEESRAAAERAGAIVGAGGAPAPVVTYFRLMQTGFTPGRLKGSRWTWVRPRIVAALTQLSRDPLVAGDARSQAAVRLRLASYQSWNGIDRDGAIATLTAIADDARLGPRDQFKVAALARLATLQAAGGDRAAAQASFARSGLDGVQCSLADVRPRMTHSGARATAYPKEAMKWGFEGWVTTEYDIAADGTPQNVRTTIAYPPFTFAAAAESASRDSRFEQSFRPAGAMGCGGQTMRVGFRIGGY